MKEKKKTNTIGLVLSGGGIRGIAQIGVIKLLEELDIRPTHIAGTSVGAIVGGLYAKGCSVQEILDFFLTTRPFHWKNYAFRKAGFLDLEKLRPSLSSYFPENDFKALPRKLYITRTNLESGEGEIVNTGKIVDNIMASMALPIMFAPVDVDGISYADGGIVNNFPVDAISDQCDHVIGVYVNPIPHKSKEHFKSSFSVVERAFHIGMAHNCTPKFQFCDVLIIPEKLEAHSIIDVKHIKEIFEIGYEAALKETDALVELFQGDKLKPS